MTQGRGITKNCVRKWSQGVPHGTNWQYMAYLWTYKMVHKCNPKASWFRTCDWVGHTTDNEGR